MGKQALHSRSMEIPQIHISTEDLDDSPCESSSLTTPTRSSPVPIPGLRRRQSLLVCLPSQGISPPKSPPKTHIPHSESSNRLLHRERLQKTSFLSPPSHMSLLSPSYCEPGYHRPRSSSYGCIRPELKPILKKTLSFETQLNRSTSSDPEIKSILKKTSSYETQLNTSSSSLTDSAPHVMASCYLGGGIVTDTGSQDELLRPPLPAGSNVFEQIMLDMGKPRGRSASNVEPADVAKALDKLKTNQVKSLPNSPKPQQKHVHWYI